MQDKFLDLEQGTSDDTIVALTCFDGTIHHCYWDRVKECWKKARFIELPADVFENVIKDTNDKKKLKSRL